MKKEKWTENSHRILEQADGLTKYNRWLISHFSLYFGRVILEIGSGQGTLSKLLPTNSIIILSDIFPAYLTRLKKIFTDPVINLNIEKETPANLIGKMDTIFSSNVFEHIENDKQAFANCFKLLEPQGRLLLFVPARPEIFGKLDEQMGHYRRYTKNELRKKVEAAGFEVEKIYYANLLGYFLWWGRGKVLPLVTKVCHSRPDRESIRLINIPKSDKLFSRVFEWLIVPLLYLEKYIHPPFGQSLVLIAKKSNIQAH
ncbi:MAG: hypothetical protein UX08_C0001G0064 [Candidatus Collierbacteria bacterium GW2011_GWB1_45_35]|uniref:Methyltransferase type 12 n=1 Tax=Candidatus Collierbacteria bacterium GW2011_GWB2_45_17 TaxID=1618388 RepID=A0A837IJA8_9BACT|nr:MAG: hypothetical protein UW48_C0003G0061 [Microgenomates group bacterium GW2011_GWC1_44_23]KKT95926.1 MAG: hypothetical protein UW96_C0003G0061 [Candidatus Collierbacteria bacterium GW2011_GWA1_45_15]KKU00970.1 MAG: hypothetical protein UX01_C0003G0023 [Candidatus Collierbacteria bacterium GW2011_GWB2_45_17]KKU05937.1 MAG: hypothetical protein UX08_C0001G0064 [Candidatus Collierbacteria bacterium GW2011_GWB1_45_35]KKU08590.1 MAG: hypothetical protein UX11_C0002G0030 [Candidatus Collierbacte